MSCVYFHKTGREAAYEQEFKVGHKMEANFLSVKIFDPLGRPTVTAGSGHYFLHMSSEWIIDDTCLVFGYFCVF